MTIKLWISDEVPGGVVKSEVSSGGKTLMKRMVTGWEMK